MPFVSTFGGTLHYETLGERSGPPVLLLHALGASLSMWDLQAEALQSQFHVIRFSIRGHGRSQIDPAGELDFDALTRDALLVLDALGVEKAHWCGLSLGGMTALWAGAHHPARVVSLIAASASAHMPPADLWTTRMTTARTEGMGPLAEAALDRWFTLDFRRNHGAEINAVREMVRACDPAGYAAACAAIRDMDQRETVGRINCPALILAGAHDVGTPLPMAQFLHEHIAGSALVSLPGAHLTNIECASAFNDALLAHLAGPTQREPWPAHARAARAR